MLILIFKLCLEVILPDTPQAEEDAKGARTKGDPVSCLVAIESLSALPVAIW